MMSGQSNQPETSAQPWNRRRCLKLFGTALPASFGLSGCSDDSSTDVGRPQPESPSLPADLPLAVWNAMREAVQASPDHLAQRAREVAQSKDPEQIHAFVRDNFLTRPNRLRGLSVDFRDQVAWGVSGLLRSGVGTAREKAELLKALYEEAGYSARLLTGEIDTQVIGVTKLSTGQAVPEFAPDEEAAPLEEWLSLVSKSVAEGEASAGTTLEEIDFQSLDEDSIRTQLTNALPDDHKVPE